MAIKVNEKAVETIPVREAETFDEMWLKKIVIDGEFVNQPVNITIEAVKVKTLENGKKKMCPKPPTVIKLEDLFKEMENPKNTRLQQIFGLILEECKERLGW
jgi:hypothetical protein